LSFTSDPLSPDPIVELRRVRLERLLQAASHDYDLSFEFGQRDLIGDGQILMKAAPQEVLSARYPLLKGRALHLLGHCLSDSQLWLEAARRESQSKPRFLGLWHALEDARVENWFIQRWPGAYKSFEASLLPNLGGSLLKLMSPIDQLELGLYYEGRGYLGAQYSRRVSSVLDEQHELILRAAWGDSARHSFQAMLEIYPAVAHLVRLTARQTHEKPLDRPSSDEEEIGAGHAENQPAQSPLLDGLPEIEVSDQTVAVGVLGRRREFPEWFRPGSAPWFERGLGGKEIHPSALRTNRQTIVAPPLGDYDTYQHLRNEIQQEVGFLTHRLTNRIREEVYLRYGGHYRSGKLSMGKLWKQRIGNYRLFQRPVSGRSRVAAFSLLVDESASMKGQDNYKIAMKAALLLGETLELLGAPLEIIGFTTAEFEARAAMRLGLTPAYQYRTTRCSPLEHRLYKRFDEPYPVARVRLTGIQPRCNNWDEEHLAFAFQRIQERAEANKIIIVISDGQPNGDADYLVQSVERVENLGVKVIGIGVGADFVRQIYPHSIVVSDFRQMAQELLDILAREFQPGVIP
jgi:Cobalamin biosynthesis protein CobT VWA domain